MDKVRQHTDEARKAHPARLQKIAGYEKDELAAGHGMDYYTREYLKLEEMLKESSDRSALPKQPAAEDRLNRLLIDLRRQGLV
jgi:hypothetical protein